MVRPAKRDGELVADLAPKRSRLGKFQMVGVRGTLLADKASLAANERKMLLAPTDARILEAPTRRGSRKPVWNSLAAHDLPRCLGILRIVRDTRPIVPLPKRRQYLPVEEPLSRTKVPIELLADEMVDYDGIIDCDDRWFVD